MRTQHASTSPLFVMANQAVKVKENVNDTLDSCGAAVIGGNHPEVIFMKWGQENFDCVSTPL